MLKFLIVISFMLSGACSFAEVPALEREITLSLSNEKLRSALNKIQEQTGLIFSYPSSILNNAPAVSLKLKQKTVREALILLLPKGITFKARNNYIILKEKPVEKNPKKTELSGYVYDKTTEKKIANVTIYDKASLQSVTTNDYGYYSISVPSTNQNIVINKENYKDTALVLANIKENDLTNITLDPLRDSVQGRDSAIWKTKLKDFSQYTLSLFKKFKGYVTTLNVKDTLSRNLQVSLLPFIGTNHKLSGTIYNHYSFNILGGYSRGVRGMEMGTLFNIDKENMIGAQFAGLFNMVGNRVSGAQFAGLFNVTGKSQKGFQAAGLVNYNHGRQAGAQAAGLMNLNQGQADGIRMAGLMNLNDSTTTGVQLAGLLNLNKKSSKGFSAAGLCNLVADTLKGVNVSGLFNHTSKATKGVQVAGMFNSCSGGGTALQVAGLFNYTKYLQGAQLAPFNFCDSASGVPIGVFSFVKTGVHQLELSADEVFYTNASFRTGVPAFYNIFSASISAGSGNVLWGIGYGIGTSFRIKNKLRSDFTLSTQHVNSGSFSTNTAELYKAYLGLEYRFNKKLSLAAGPVFNVYMSDVLSADYAGKYDAIAPYSLAENTSGNGTNIKFWIGGKIAVRFF